MPLLKTSRTSLSGKTAIVTGASAGIGRQIAIRLAEEGLQVALAARNAEKLEELTEQLHRQGRTAISVPTDVVQHEQLVRLVQRVKTEFGRIDILVNNAGVGTFHDFHTLPLPEVRKAIDVNLTAAIELSQLVLPSMLEFRWGRIVNMASTAGKHGPAFGAVYGATKAALIAFTQSLRSEYHGTGVSATVICPGFTNDGGVLRTHEGDHRTRFPVACRVHQCRRRGRRDRAGDPTRPSRGDRQSSTPAPVLGLCRAVSQAWRVRDPQGLAAIPSPCRAFRSSPPSNVQAICCLNVRERVHAARRELVGNKPSCLPARNRLRLSVFTKSISPGANRLRL